MSLSRLQRWFQAVLTHPGGVEAGADSAEARGCFDVGPDGLEKVATRSRQLSAAERIGIYHNAYFARLLECLREEFQVFHRTVGEEVFDAFALDYLVKHPPHSYTLGRLGERFPQFLAETRPEGEEAGDWSDFLIDLATLERAIGEVFDGPGVESEPPLGPDALARVPAECWAEVRLAPAPCLRLLTLRFPVQRYYTAARRGQDEPPPPAAPTHLAVSRLNFVVRHHDLSPVEFALLGGLIAGQNLGDAIGQAVEAGADPAELAGQLGDWFQRWTAERFFRAVYLADSDRSGSATSDGSAV